MARTRPFPKSFLGCGTSTVSSETELLKTWCEPVARTSVHPSRSRRRTMSRLLVNMNASHRNHMMEDRCRLAHVERGGLNPLHETIDHLFLAGFFKRDGEFVAVDFHHVAIAEFLVEHAVVEIG